MVCRPTSQEEVPDGHRRCTLRYSNALGEIAEPGAGNRGVSRCESAEAFAEPRIKSLFITERGDPRDSPPALTAYDDEPAAPAHPAAVTARATPTSFLLLRHAVRRGRVAARPPGALATADAGPRPHRLALAPRHTVPFEHLNAIDSPRECSRAPAHRDPATGPVVPVADLIGQPERRQVQRQAGPAAHLLHPGPDTFGPKPRHNVVVPHRPPADGRHLRLRRHNKGTHAAAPAGFDPAATVIWSVGDLLDQANRVAAITVDPAAE